MKTLKIIYRKNLKMTPGKLAAQCVHASAGLLDLHEGEWHEIFSAAYGRAVVLEASDKKFFQAVLDLCSAGVDHYVTVDVGHTECNPDTETCLAYWEQSPDVK